MPATLTINAQTIEADPDRSLFDLAESLAVPVPTSCRKNGKCKECIVEIADGADLLSQPTPAEQHLKPPFRLSCQARIVATGGHVQCHTMRRGRMRIEREASSLPFRMGSAPLQPAVTRADHDRILLDGNEIARSTAPIHGLAMDLGTTTVVLRLYNLESGELLADTSFENPQRFAGSDVMSRIHYDTQHGDHLLQRTLAGYLTHAIESFPVDPRTIYELVVVGNSTMRDLFFRLDVYPIGQTPYRSITELELEEGKRTTTAVEMSPKRAGLPLHPSARVYGLPIISGHVGADAAACMLATNLADEDRLVAVMDIGTNTELILGNKHRILAASCPAGPAFEGGGVSCGMPALEGAIETVRHNDSTGRFDFEIIGDPPPQGICGSGLVDLLSELLRTGKMNEFGRFEDTPSIPLDPDHDLHFRESDVNELAQAKGANVAGLHVVLDTWFNTPRSSPSPGTPGEGRGEGRSAQHEVGVQNGTAIFHALDLFYLAGGFGRHLKVDPSKRIGLIPDLPNEKIHRIGNAAIEGAAQALLDIHKRRELEQLVRRVEHCRLETHPNFFNFFVDGCQFKPLTVTPHDDDAPSSPSPGTGDYVSPGEGRVRDGAGLTTTSSPQEPPQ